MTIPEAVNYLRKLLDTAIQRGIIADAPSVVKCMEALNYLEATATNVVDANNKLIEHIRETEIRQHNRVSAGDMPGMEIPVIDFTNKSNVNE